LFPSFSTTASFNAFNTSSSSSSSTVAAASLSSLTTSSSTSNFCRQLIACHCSPHRSYVLLQQQRIDELQKEKQDIHSQHLQITK
jgi:hypothetical protein